MSPNTHITKHANNDANDDPSAKDNSREKNNGKIKRIKTIRLHNLVNES